MREMPKAGFVCTGDNALELSGAICCAGRLMRFFNEKGYVTGGCYSCIAPQKQIDSLVKRVAALCECNDVVLTVGCEGFRECDVMPETVLKIAFEQQRRGADIVKIVTASNSDEELMENLRITTLLKKELKVPFLYLSGGTHSKLHRMIGAQLGCVTYLAVQMHDERAVPTQPTIRAAKAVRDHLDYLPDLPL